MGARTGMANLISRWRRLVADSGTATWSDDQAQQILDEHRQDLYAEPLLAIGQTVSGGEAEYRVYQSRHGNLEESTSGTAIWRLYDSTGASAGTANYSVDYLRGVVTFTADTEGTAYYLDARSYDLNAAAAAGWREMAAGKASYYQFQADGASYNRQQWFEHCLKMADYYEGMATPVIVALGRSDLNCSYGDVEGEHE